MNVCYNVETYTNPVPCFFIQLNVLARVKTFRHFIHAYGVSNVLIEHL